MQQHREAQTEMKPEWIMIVLAFAKWSKVPYRHKPEINLQNGKPGTHVLIDRFAPPIRNLGTIALLDV